MPRFSFSDGSRHQHRAGAGVDHQQPPAGRAPGRRREANRGARQRPGRLSPGKTPRHSRGTVFAGVSKTELIDL